jgi:hypothetical protein
MLGILIVGAVILWYTPYAMAGLVKQTDTLWHMGTSMSMPEVLAGGSLPYSSYLSSFPLSFSFGYIVSQATGLDVVMLGNYLMPLIYICILVPLLFTVFRSFAGKNSAYLATLIGVGLMYHVSVHHSPQVVGTVLMLFSIMLVLKRRYAVAAVIGLALLPVTHIISFALFLVFLLTYLLYERYAPMLSSKLDLGMLRERRTIMVVAALISGMALAAILFRSYISTSLSRFSIAGMPSFVWDNMVGVPWFKQITSIQYLAMFAIMAHFAVKFILKARDQDDGLIKRIFRMDPRMSIAFTFAWLCLAAGLFIGMMGNSSVLIERGVTFFILFSALFIIARQADLSDVRTLLSRRSGKVVAIVIVLAFMTYPLGSYAIDAYNSFPSSEGAGLAFLADDIRISNATIDMSSPGQLNAYIEPGSNVSIGSLNSDYIVWRLHAEYKDRLHDSNATMLKFDALDHNSSYNKIYSNPSFEVYVRTRGSG